MAKRVKTDLFAGIMNEPVTETDATAEELSVTVSEKKQVTGNKKKPGEKPSKKTSASTSSASQKESIKNPVVENSALAEEGKKSIDEFLQKVEKPKAASHTFYLKDVTFKKLEDAAKKKKTSPSKLLEAMIEMTLN